jgi:hydrogenase maturation protease
VYQLCDTFPEIENREIMSLIVGLGSPHGDDQLGWVAIDRLRPLLRAGILARKVRDGFELLEVLEGHDSAVIIDAAAPAGRPGSILSFTWPCAELVHCVFLSSHGLGLVEAIRLAEALDRLPYHVKIYTIEAQNTSPGAPLGDDIARRLDALVECVLGGLAVID